MHKFIPVDFDPFEEGREIEKITFTNEPQREIWLSCIIGGNDANLSYNESVSLEITGDLNIDAFKRSVKDLVQRHEALRATVSPNGETLIIYKELPVTFELEDISGLDEAKRKSEFAAFLKHEINVPLDLYAGPMLRVFLHKTSNKEYYFTIIKHHIIGDGWSTGIMLEDLSRMYNAYINGNEPALDAPAQISDYADAQASFRLLQAYKETERYWLDQYKNNVPVLDLHTDNPRFAPRSYKGNRIDTPISKDMAAQLKAVGAKAGCSLVTTLLAAFEVFLYKETHQRDIVVGLPSSGQAASGLTNVVGHCVNLLPIRSAVDPTASFADYLKKRKKEVLDAYDHQRLTFGELIKKLYIPRDPSRIPLVPVMFNIDMGMDNAVRFEGLDFNLISNPRYYENFELYLNATGSKDGIILEWSYNTDLFKPETIHLFNEHYHHILQRIIADTTISIADLAGDTERSIIVSMGKEVNIPLELTINTLLADTAKQYSTKTAVTFNNHSLTYQQLFDKTEQLSTFLLQKGIKAGDTVALSSDRSIEMLVCLLAILKTGAAYLPLDPEYPQERIAFMLADSSAKLLLTTSKYKGKFSGTNEMLIEDIWPELNKITAPQQPSKTITGNDFAYILYTSGSTGMPKGVQITHRNLVNFLLSMQTTPGIKDTDKLLAITSISFDIAGLELYLPLISGAEVIIACTDDTKDGRILLDIIAKKKASIMQATPSTWQMMLDSGWQKKFPIKILSGGEALPKDLADNLMKMASELWNMYGPTETTIWSTIKQISPSDHQLTIGKPINNTYVYILNDHGQPLSVNQQGEIYIGGEGVAAGYWARQELTVQRFVPDTISGNSDGKLYRTGDIGKILDNGEITCLGRTDHQVKIRGHRIELREIEAAISKLDGIKQCVVLAREDMPGDKRLVAYITLDDYSVESIDSWKKSISAELPVYMIPPDFITLKSFPLTPNAKIDRNALPKPQRTESIKDNASVKLTANEQIVTEVWSEILGVENLKPSDDFFLLGGHSLMAVRVMVALEKKTGKKLPVAILFTNSTIEKLALQLSDDKEVKKWDALVPIKTTGSKTPVFLVHGSGLHLLLFKSIVEYFDEDQPVYGLQALGLDHETDIPDTIEEIAKRYVADILDVYPDGPYSLAGYSLGGFIVFEMARLLKEMGKEIKLLGMIDTYAGNNYYVGNTFERAFKKVNRQFNKIPFIARSLMAHPKETIDYQLLAVKRKLGISTTTTAPAAKNSLSPYEQMINKKYNDAMESYILTPFDVEMTLFRAEKRLYFLDDLVYLGWGKFALKGVNVLPIPGDHKTYLYPPNNKQFARILQKVLNETKKLKS